MEENKTVDNIGNLVISEDVIASIALNAAKDVEGVSSFAARPDNDVKIYIHVNIAPGTKIPKVAADIQKNVKNAVQSMTGKMVSKVNVSIAGMDIKPESEK